jgi:hypothetical protein
MSAEQLDKLKKALANTKSDDFHWMDLDSQSHKMYEGTPVPPEETILDLNSTYSGLFNNTVSINIGSSSSSIGSSGSYMFSNGSNPVWTTNTTAGFNTISPSMEVKGDFIVNGKNIGNILDKIQDRLAILDEPSLEKLEKHAALKKAYEQYKLLEKLIGEE